ncbi:MAG: glycoside hydrolase family 15 protein, partial [candidate division Zixibacteria bacterium]|nr:glycoside hydrolase family 15 protein [candidate division Zixibacteria bacterium]NIX59596.1 glycoside hydrolase family 15 protein [candidate division Zixibacteria bacterium]
NHLGLFSEGIDFITKRLLGNFPQGYSHLALVDAILTLNEGSASEDEV